MAGPRAWDSTVKIVSDPAAAGETVYIDPTSMIAFPPATPTTPGVLSAADKALLDSLVAARLGDLTVVLDGSVSPAASSGVAVYYYGDPITADRTVLNPQNPTFVFDRFVVRTGAATGAFSVLVKNWDGTTLKDLVYNAAGIWARVRWDGTNWRLIGFGTLDLVTVPDNSAALSNVNPVALGASAAPGSATSGARQDHVHPTTGLVLSALIGAASGVVPLDGSSHISTAYISGSNASGNKVIRDVGGVLTFVANPLMVLVYDAVTYSQGTNTGWPLTAPADVTFFILIGGTNAQRPSWAVASNSVQLSTTSGA